jgi:CheY-like chemotaxis protein
VAKILLLDDNETILKLLSSVLSSKGHKVTACKDPVDAIELIRREQFEVLLTDLVFPSGTNGFDLIRTIRKDQNITQMPIIVITGQRMEKKDVARAISEGANDYVVKPANPEMLDSKINHWIKNSTQTSEKTVNYSILNAKGKWDADIKIIKLTETGLEVKSPFLVQVDTKIKIQSECFKDIGIQPPWLKVVLCTRSPGTEGYDITLKFVDITEKETGSIKDWIRLTSSQAS